MRKILKFILSFILILWLIDQPFYFTHSPSLLQEYLLGKMDLLYDPGFEHTSLGLFSGVSNGFLLIIASVPVSFFRAIIEYIVGFEGEMHPGLWLFFGIFWSLFVNLISTIIAYLLLFIISLLTFTNPLFYVGSFLGVYLGIKLLKWIFSTSNTTRIETESNPHVLPARSHTDS